MAVRPPDIRISTAEEKEAIAGKVSVVQYYGLSRLVSIEIGNISLRAVVDKQ
ncbi:MAG: hypothetical protein DRO13_04200 [Thermoprotei archaeon]|nr:MAG: hypothetical protein DRO13_04200 [Thermoprotei archaeon]